MSGNSTFKIGDCLVEQDLDRISRGCDTVTVRPQVMDVLVYLASRGGQIVHADELLEDLWPGKVVTSASVYNCITELRHAFLTCDDGQSYVDTVPKRGCRLIAPVTGLEESGEVASQNDAAPLSRRVGFIAISLLAATVLLFAWYAWWPAAPMDKSIAVMAFENLSDDPEQEYFSDGISEELLNVLAQTFDRELADIFALQSEVARAIADEIQVALAPTVEARISRVRTVDPETYSLWLKANYLVSWMDDESLRKAVVLYEEAIARDADYTPAYAGLAKAYMGLGGWFTSNLPDEFKPLAHRTAERAIEFEADCRWKGRIGLQYLTLHMELTQ